MNPSIQTVRATSITSRVFRLLSSWWNRSDQAVARIFASSMPRWSWFEAGPHAGVRTGSAWFM